MDIERDINGYAVLVIFTEHDREAISALVIADRAAREMAGLPGFIPAALRAALDSGIRAGISDLIGTYCPASSVTRVLSEVDRYYRVIAGRDAPPADFAAILAMVVTETAFPVRARARG